MGRKSIVLGLLVAIMSVGAFGAGFMGPPTAELKKGQWSVGYNYMYSDMDLERAKMTWRLSADDELLDALEDGVIDWEDLAEFFGFDGPALWALAAELDFVVDEDDIADLRVPVKTEIKDFKIQRHYATLGYGVEDWLEVYFQLGGADVKTKTQNRGDVEWEGLNFDNDFAWGWGTRITFHEQDNIRWGTSIQMNWLATDWDDTEVWEIADDVTLTRKREVDIETYDLLIAVGPTVDMGGWKMYGGPFIYYLSGDVDQKTTGTLKLADESVSGQAKASGDLDADKNFGAFIGAQFALRGNADLTTELSFTGDSWAFGTGITWKF